MSAPEELAVDRAYIAETRAHILALRHRIASLKAKMIPVQKRLDSYVYPVLSLPNEIVSEIFGHFIPLYPLCPPLTGLLSPMVLTHICHRWREITLKMPSLWRAIQLEDHCDDDPISEAVECWLSRSRGLPLSISQTSYTKGVADGCVERLVLHSARWEHVQLRLHSRSHLAIVTHAMPLIRQLEIRVVNLKTGVSPPVCYRDMPRLRSVTLWNFDYPAGFLPWSQLTSLTLVCKSFAQCTAILRDTVNLIHCELAIWGDSDRQPDVRLERLQSLVLMPYDTDLLDWMDPEEMSQYLNTLITPALRMLDVPNDLLEPHPIEALSTFVSKAGCRLDSVYITGESSVAKHLYRAAFPSIKRISFDNTKLNYTDLRWA
ncbi:hypothetical protein B0H15DRAFT_578112 [Mycena belliarum]|uniref:F-box domain-containing protein n=1 Tax=Mycena belliarum TaxID=1033014 RepID=A0AAD6XKI4_9AGAR|nr:hypothetical protein B0H15DRAFT_578112 [Mycena belliae]